MRLSCRTRVGIALAVVLCWTIIDSDSEWTPYYGVRTELLALNPRYGIGRGKGPRRRRIQRVPIDLFRYFDDNGGCGNSFQRLIRLSFEDFLFLMGQLRGHLDHTAVQSVSLENQVLLVFIWIHHYPTYASLSIQFGISPGSITRVIDSILPQIAQFFKKFIPNQLIPGSPSSRLSNQIVAVIDGTIHRTTRPQSGQFEYYNVHYSQHGIISQILCDFSGLIIAFITGIKGNTHDSQICSVRNELKRILGGKYCLGDPAYVGVAGVVAGYKPAHLPKTKGHAKFNTKSREEQVIIEHVNCWLKKSVSVDKDTKFRHGHGKLVLCTFIVCGLYNYKKINEIQYYTVSPLKNRLKRGGGRGNLVKEHFIRSSTLSLNRSIKRK